MDDIGKGREIIPILVFTRRVRLGKASLDNVAYAGCQWFHVHFPDVGSVAQKHCCVNGWQSFRGKDRLGTRNNTLAHGLRGLLRERSFRRFAMQLRELDAENRCGSVHQKVGFFGWLNAAVNEVGQQCFEPP
jgi:hypothetical protein